ncbi:MAG: hypothetical protein ACRC24_04295 [Vibrionaceae bacterium]
MKKLLLAIAVLTAAGAQAGLNETSRIEGAEFNFPFGMEVYQAGTKVQHNDRLFQCREGDNAGFCKQWSVAANHYEPGVGFAWQEAWTEITPVAKGGVDYHFKFPEKMDFYMEGALVEHDGEVYRCKPYPNAGYCSQWSESANQYEPKVGFAWQMAWDHVGPAGNQLLSRF